MKVLVLWTDSNPPSTSIVDKKDVKKTAKSVKAKWGKAWLDVKVIAENDDEKWLESLTISTEGNIIKDCQVDPKQLAKKRQSKKQKQENLKKKKEAIEQINDESVKGRSIFSESDDELSGKINDSSNLTKDAVVLEHSEEPETTEGTSKDKVAKAPNKEPETTAGTSKDKVTKTPNKDTKRLRSTKLASSCYFCKITPEDASYEEKFMAIAESSLLHLQNLREQYGMSPVSTSEVVLAPGSDIKIDRYRLNDFLRFSNGDPKALTRYILKEIINEKELSQMNASTMPKEIFSSVERYVNSHVSNSKKLNLSEFKRCVTLYCASLKIKQNNKETKDKSKIEKRHGANSSDEEYSNEEGSAERSSPSRSRSKSRSKSRESSEEKSKGESRNRSRSKSTEKTQSKSRNRSKSKSRENSNGRNRSKSRSRSKSKSRENSNGRNRSKSRSRSKSKSRENSNGRNRSKSRSINRSKSREENSGMSKENGRMSRYEQWQSLNDKSGERKEKNQSSSRSRSKSRSIRREKSRERNKSRRKHKSKKKSKKRKRSRSSRSRNSKKRK